MAIKPTHTKPRSLRVRDPLWEAAQRTAAKRDETVTDAVTRFLERYARDELRADQDDTPTR